MLIIRLLRWFRGSVLFAIYGDAESFLTKIANKQIKLWNMYKRNGIIYANSHLDNYKKIARCTKKIPCRIRIKKRQGFPFVAIKYKKRIGIFAGIFLFFAFLLFMQNFAWRIEIKGNENLSLERITKIAEICGIYRGAYLPGLDIPDVEQQMKVELEEISWIAINRMGSKVEIVVWETTEKPKIEESTPCNVIAKKPGHIIYMDVYNGQEILKEGDSVNKGDLIVSGMVEDKKGNLTLKHANARVMARTQIDKSYTFELSPQEIKYTGKEKKRYIFSVFGFKIPLYIGTNAGTDYKIESEYNNIVFFGVEMPFGIYKNTHKQYETVSANYSEDEARAFLYQEIERVETEELNEANGIKIIFKSIREKIENEVLKIEINYICVENIAELSEIHTEN